MSTSTSRAARPGLVLLAALALAGCGSSSKQAASPARARTTTAGSTVPLPAATTNAASTTASPAAPAGPLTKKQYEAFVRSLPDVFVVRCPTLSHDYATLERVAHERFAARADLLERLTPPAAVSDAHRLFIRALREFSAFSASLVPKLQRLGNPDTAPPETAARIAAKQLLLVGRSAAPRRMTADLQRARAEFAAKGYSIDQRPLSRGAYAREVRTTFAAIGDPYAVPAAGRVSELRAKLRARAERLFAAGKRLDAVTAPAAVDDANDEVASGLCRRAAELRRIATSPQLRSASEATRRSIHDGLKFMDPLLDRAVQTLRRQGYAAAPGPGG